MPGRSGAWRTGRASVWVAEPQRDRRPAGRRRCVDGGGGGGLGDGVGEHGGGEAGGGWLPVVAGGVEADDGVEVDHAACLVFGDLDVADRDQLRAAL